MLSIKTYLIESSKEGYSNNKITKKDSFANDDDDDDVSKSHVCNSGILV